MPKMPERKCKACGGTGVSSSGKPCEPCLRNKKPLDVKYCSTIKAAQLVNDKKPFSIFD